MISIITKNYLYYFIFMHVILFFSVAGARPYGYEEALSVEDFGAVNASVDGQWISFEVIKPIKKFIKPLSPSILREFSFRSLYFYDVRNGRKIQFPDGHGQSTWAGPWSPDSRKIIVFRSNIKTGATEIGVFDLLANEYRILPGIPSVPSLLKFGSAQHLFWKNSDTVIYAVNNEGNMPWHWAGERNLDQGQWLAEIYTKHLPGKAFFTEHNTGKSGILVGQKEHDLLEVNVHTGSKKVLATGVIIGMVPSPDGKYIAVITQTDKFFSPPDGVGIGTGRHLGWAMNALHILNLDYPEEKKLISKGVDVYFMLPVTWDENSYTVAYYGFKPGFPWETAEPYIYNINEDKSLKLKRGGLHLVSPRNRNGAGGGAVPIIFRDGVPLVSVSDEHGGYDQSSVKVVKGGVKPSWRLWKLSSADVPVEVYNGIVKGEEKKCYDIVKEILFGDEVSANVSAGAVSNAKVIDSGEILIDDLQCDYDNVENGRNSGYALLFSSNKGNSGSVVRIVELSGRKKEIGVSDLSKGDVIKEISLESGYLVYQSAPTSTGTSLNLVVPSLNNTPIVMHEINKWTAELDHYIIKKFDYEVKDGVNNGRYIGWYLEPSKHKIQEKYPTIVVVYPGQVLSEDRPPISVNDHFSTFNPFIASEEGFAVLYLSVPIRTDYEPLDIPRQLAGTILSGVNAFIDLGLCDPFRFGIFGGSAGGYAAIATITQTSFFRAAVSAAGYYNLISRYGTFSAFFKDKPSGHIEMYGASRLEGGLETMLVPPWRDPQRYIRNSPIFHVENITSPVLLIHGDSDFVPVSQAEELTVALTRLGKKGRFVRYWGEGHTPERPETALHQIDEVMRWFRENL